MGDSVGDNKQIAGKFKRPGLSYGKNVESLNFAISLYVSRNSSLFYTSYVREETKL